MTLTNVVEMTCLQRSSIPPVSDVLSDIRVQCVQYASLVLQGALSEGRMDRVSPLLAPVVNQTLPRGFLPELVGRTAQNEEILRKVMCFLLCFEIGCGAS